MSLTDVASVALHLGLDLNASGEGPFLSQLWGAVEAAVIRVIDRAIELQVYTEYYGGNNTAVLPLREYPLSLPVLAGTLTSGSAVVAGLSTTTGIGVGLTVTGTGVPAATFVQSVDSATQVTLTAAATASGAPTLSFLPTVYEDAQGAWGYAANAFPAGKLLTAGVDYAPARDGRGGAAETGRLFRLGTVWGPRWESRRGLLTARLKRGAGTVRVTYSAGLNPVPADLQLCVWECCARLRYARRFGRGVQSENLGQYSYTLEQLQAQAETFLEVGSVAAVIGKYKRITPRFEHLT